MRLFSSGEEQPIDRCHIVRAGRELIDNPAAYPDLRSRAYRASGQSACRACVVGIENRWQCAFGDTAVANALDGWSIDSLVVQGAKSPPPPPVSERYTPHNFLQELFGAIHAGFGSPGSANILATRSLQDLVIRNHKAKVPVDATVNFLDQVSGLLETRGNEILYGQDVRKRLTRQIAALKEVDPRLTNYSFPVAELHFNALMAAYETARFSPDDPIASFKSSDQKIPVIRKRVGRVRPPIRVDEEDDRMKTSLELLNGLNWPSTSTPRATQIEGAKYFSVNPIFKPRLRGSQDTFETRRLRLENPDRRIRNVAGLAVRVAGGQNGPRVIAQFQANSMHTLPTLFVDELYRLLYIQSLEAAERTTHNPATARQTESRYSHIGAFVRAMTP